MSNWSSSVQATSALIHEIKNPLSTIQLNLQLMREDLQGVESAQVQRVVRRIGTLEREVQRLSQLLDSFRELTRLGEMKRQACNINRLVRELVEFVQADLRQQKVEVLAWYDEQVPELMVDSERLKQAFLNVIINSKQAMPNGGQLMVRTSRESNHVIVEITDTGEGIPSERLERIFDAFYSTKKGGMGLGLPMVRRIVEGHGGSVSVQSEPGKGTQVRIALPIEPAARPSG